MELVTFPAVPIVLEIRCCLDPPRFTGLVNGVLSATDATGARVVFHRLWDYRDDHA